MNTNASLKASPKIPFFSITRTNEGFSLITSQEAVSALFVKENADQEQNDGDVNKADESDPDPERLTCLQIDLSKYGLDKVGLVDRFSHILESNDINHMYSATYKTANILVDKMHAPRAISLLRSS